MNSLSRSGLDRLRDAMASRVDRGELPGHVTLVARRDEVHVDTVGTLAFGDGRPMRRDTIFRIASLTKPILAAATMTLIEDGTLALDAPVDDYLPELAAQRVLRRLDGALDDTVPAKRQITVEDLLTYRMGYGMIVEPTFEPPIPVVNAARELQLAMAEPYPRTPLGPNEWIKRFGTLPLMSQPGEKWRYNASAHVLSVLVARAGGQPLPGLFRTRIFEPLGMADTGFWADAGNLPRLPIEYLTDPQTGVLRPAVGIPAEEWMRPPAFPSGATGLLSTIDDYFRFARALRDGGMPLLSASTLKRMTTNHLSPEQIADGGWILGGRGWGLGMSVAVAPDDISPVPGRYGWEGGSGTSWFNDPHSGITAILMSQTSDVLFNGTLTEFGRLAIATAG